MKYIDIGSLAASVTGPSGLFSNVVTATRGVPICRVILLAVAVAAGVAGAHA